METSRTAPLILGEHRRTVDERYRLSIPPEMVAALTGGDSGCVLVKERRGALSLWGQAQWQGRLTGAVQILESKWQAGRLDHRWHDMQRLGRLLSTRHRELQLAGRGRLVIPEGFREFLGVEAGQEVLLVGAAVCLEIWEPATWVAYLNERMPEFGSLLEELSA